MLVPSFRVMGRLAFARAGDWPRKNERRLALSLIGNSPCADRCLLTSRPRRRLEPAREQARQGAGRWVLNVKQFAFGIVGGGDGKERTFWVADRKEDQAVVDRLAGFASPAEQRNLDVIRFGR